MAESIFRTANDAGERMLARMDPATAAVMFDQFWVHARHAEQQRQTFFQLYLVVVGVGVGVIGQNLADHDRSVLAVAMCAFLAASSALGMLLTFSWNVAYTIFTRQAERIQVCHMDTGAGFVNFYTPLRWPKARLRFTLTAMRLYVLVYAAGAGVFSGAAFGAASAPPALAVGGGGAVFLLSALAWERYLEPHRSLYHAQFERDIDEVLASRAAQTTLSIGAVES